MASSPCSVGSSISSSATASSSEDSDRAKTKKFLNYEEYKKIAYMLIRHIHQKEELSEAGAESQDYAPTKKDVVNWYLNELSDEIDTEEELVEKRKIVEKVLDKL